ncbi:MAG TPA: hypothetical protein VNM37_06675 [Candidatus Dormibacteraeota bacterium]|nr:hypothetical protein [Candidatus Dormibacteraeota bacterium]
MITLLIAIVVVLIVFGLVWAAFQYIPLPPPLTWVVPAVMLLLLALILLYMLLPLTGARLP